MKCYRVTSGALIAFEGATYRPNTTHVFTDDALAARLVTQYPHRFVAVPSEARASARTLPSSVALGGRVPETPSELPTRSLEAAPPPSEGRRSRARRES